MNHVEKGNAVLINSYKVGIVLEVLRKGVTAKSQQVPKGIHVDKVYPLPLTIPILMNNLGFLRNQERKNLFHHPQYNGLSLILSGETFYVADIMQHPSGKKIQFVHQFQNYHFWATDIELVFSPDWERVDPDEKPTFMNH
ncbi:MAG: hypothetical protein H6765_04605 [Candidatus Peribacteria bacterium]|nr:MAG: hypothetical protein H6765_04605 [Candidatus Peribacteria bacterium]